MPAPNKEGYVHVPLPPAYLLAILARLEKENRSNQPLLFIYPSKLTYSKADIHGLVPKAGYTPEQVQKDLPRSYWKLGKRGLDKKEDYLYGKVTRYDMDLITENVTPQANRLYVQWQADSQQLRYTVLDSQGQINEGVISANVLKTQLGAQRYNAFIQRLTIRQSDAFVKRNTITKTNLVDLLGDTKCTKFIKTNNLEENTENSFLLSASHKKNLLDHLLITFSDPFLEDLLRITAKAGHTSPPGPDTTIEETVSRSNSPESGLNLTEDEARALYAFRVSVEKDSITQGGIFSFPEVAIANWIMRSRLIPIKQTVWHVIRNGEKLEVIYTQSVTFNNFTHNKIPLLYSNRYEIQKKGDGFALTRRDDDEDVGAWFEKDFFNNILIPKALRTLAATTFNEDDLLLFIPFLSDEEFAHQFSERFIRQRPKKETLDFLIEHILLCFGDLGSWNHRNLLPLAVAKLATTQFDEKDLRFFIPFLNDETFAYQFSQKLMSQQNISEKTLHFLINQINLHREKWGFWDRHQGKITLSIAGLFLAAIAVTTIVMTFGLPVVMGVLGGALFFGLSAAAVGVVTTVLGALVGTKFDTDYLLLFTLDNIKTALKGKLVEEKVLDERTSVEEEEEENNIFLTHKDTSADSDNDNDNDNVTPKEKNEPTVQGSKGSDSGSSRTSDSDSEMKKTKSKSLDSSASEEFKSMNEDDEKDVDSTRDSNNTSLSTSTSSTRSAGDLSSVVDNYSPPLFPNPKDASTDESTITSPTPRFGKHNPD